MLGLLSLAAGLFTTDSGIYVSLCYRHQTVANIVLDVLSRCPRVTDSAQADPDQKTRLNQSNEQNTLKVMMYIFPRQFGLHNVFNSKVDYLKTAQKLPDYTLREEEINSLFKDQKIRTPKRLRGDVKRLVEHLQSLHGRCAYVELLRHHCPSAIDGTTRKSAHKKPAKPSGTQLSLTYTQATAPASRSAVTTKHRHKARQQAPSIPTIKFDAVTDLATPAPHVSAFCRAVLARLIPSEFWGSGPDQAHNRGLVFKRVDHFVRLRRFESMSLEEVTDGIKVSRSASLLKVLVNSMLGHSHGLAGTTKTERHEDQPVGHEEAARDPARVSLLYF